MIVKLQTQQLSSLEQVRLLMAGTAAVPFAIAAHQDRYHWLARSLGQFGYLRLRRPERGLIIRFLCKVTGYSRAQLTRRHSDNGSEYVNHRVAKLLNKTAHRIHQVSLAPQQRERLGRKQKCIGRVIPTAGAHLSEIPCELLSPRCTRAEHHRQPNQAVKRVNKARTTLFEQIRRTPKHA
jgi:hypothetical protein